MLSSKRDLGHGFSVEILRRSTVTKAVALRLVWTQERIPEGDTEALIALPTNLKRRFLDHHEATASGETNLFRQLDLGLEQEGWLPISDRQEPGDQGLKLRDLVIREASRRERRRERVGKHLAQVGEDQGEQQRGVSGA
jgi:hypothetical protein